MRVCTDARTSGVLPSFSTTSVGAASTSTRSVTLLNPETRSRRVVLYVPERITSGTSTPAAPSFRTVTATNHPLSCPAPAGRGRGERIMRFTTEIHQLKDLIPICAYCRKIRNDDNYWQQVEVYINEQTGSNFTHGICPNCSKELLDSLPK